MTIDTKLFNEAARQVAQNYDAPLVGYLGPYNQDGFDQLMALESEIAGKDLLLITSSWWGSAEARDVPGWLYRTCQSLAVIQPSKSRGLLLEPPYLYWPGGYDEGQAWRDRFDRITPSMRALAELLQPWLVIEPEQPWVKLLSDHELEFPPPPDEDGLWAYECLVAEYARWAVPVAA